MKKPYINCHEKYHLPVMLTLQDLEVEKAYLNFYNDEYWKKYDAKRLKRRNGKNNNTSY